MAARRSWWFRSGRTPGYGMSSIRICTTSTSRWNRLRALHSRKITFGLREVTWRGKDLLVNGRVVNIRSTHFGLDFPLTGYPATDVESWKKIIRRCQEFGLNGIRFHSCCPPDAAFTAADELGFYLQAECGLWAPFFKDGVFTRYLEEETPLLLQAYGNHPSFILFSPANEPGGRFTEVTPQWASEVVSARSPPALLGGHRLEPARAGDRRGPVRRAWCASAAASCAMSPAGSATISAPRWKGWKSRCSPTRSASGAPIRISR